MSTKFFNNSADHTLFAKLKGIASAMKGFDRFLAVAGFFRSSGYFKLRKELGEISEIKILVGINIDEIFRKHNQRLLMFADPEKAKAIYQKEFTEDINDARYTKEVEEGISQMIEDLVSKRLEIKIHATKNLHAKFYLCLPKEHNENSDGWVIMGSSNISESGLGIKQPPQYELNVALKDYDDVKYCVDQFQELWKDAVPLTAEDIKAYKKETYLGIPPTPYELYLKILIDTFGEQVEDNSSTQLPNGVKELKYQKDAVVQGYQILMRHHGLFLADVVGLGKTMIAAMIAKRFVEENGKQSTLLVVHPPALEENWKNTFTLFGIEQKAHFITNASLSKILDGEEPYKKKEAYDLIIVDEAHGFRNESAGKYDELQRICKAPCQNPGFLRGQRKKVMLLSATPLNNRPKDLLNLLLLFQDSQYCTIDGIPNLNTFFTPLIKEYKKIMKNREHQEVTEEIDKIYGEIRNKVIDKVTIRRTRNNILNAPDYRADIEKQGIIFPKIQPPEELIYKMDDETSSRFYETLKQLTDGKSDNNPSGKGLNYARYRAVEFLNQKHSNKYGNAVHIGQSLANIYRVHMVKRLESSFYAFKKSLGTLLRITTDMIKMFEENQVIIARDLKVKDLQAKGMELDKILEYAINDKGYSEAEIRFSASDFRPEFLEMLRHDEEILRGLETVWRQVEKDPKFDLFQEKLASEFFEKEINPSGKLVLFSESVDTLDYLYDRLTQKLGRTDVLKVTASNRQPLSKTIQENFDANFEDQKEDYNIIITSDVLSEGVNLHRSNIVVNYDSPWNATRLMQRIGRVNRIGSTAPYIYNYMFYPSQEGDQEIQLYKNALIKLQGFHSAFGEDAQIYSREEIVRVFKIFDNRVQDTVDEKNTLLREVRDLYYNNPTLYQKIKELPVKSRVVREGKEKRGTSVIFLSSSVKREFYLASDNEVKAIDFLEAVKYLKATPEEKAHPLTKNEEEHYNHVRKALQQYATEYDKASDTSSINSESQNTPQNQANRFLRLIQQNIPDDELKQQCKQLIEYINKGAYTRLPHQINKLAKKYNNDLQEIKSGEASLKKSIAELLQNYQSQSEPHSQEEVDRTAPQIIISEYFI